MICTRAVRCLRLLRSTTLGNHGNHGNHAKPFSAVTFLDLIPYHQEYLSRPKYPANLIYTETTQQGICEQFISQCEYYLATHRAAEAVHLVRQTVCTKLLNKDCRTTDRLCEMVHDQLSKQLTSSNEEKREKAVLGLLDHLDVIFILAQTRTEFGTLLEENKLIEKVLQAGNVGDIQCLIKRFPDPTTFQSSLVIKASGLDCIPLVYKAIEDYGLLTNRAAISLCYVLLSKEEVAAVMEVLSCHGESRVLFNVVKKMWRLGWKEEVRVIVEEVEEGEKRRGLEEMVEGLEVPKE